jgi:DNA-binding CsgD family transcriptional regulator
MVLARADRPAAANQYENVRQSMLDTTSRCRSQRKSMTMEDQRIGPAREENTHPSRDEGARHGASRSRNGHGNAFDSRPSPRAGLELRSPRAAATSMGEIRTYARDAALGAEAGDRAILAELMDFPVPSESMLRRIFDLTPAEARLAQSLTRGDSLDEVAQALNIKMTTARTQLAAIFGKTRTCRQAQLVAILSRLAHLC